MFLLAAARLNQDVELALGLKDLSISLPSFLLMTPDEVIRLLVKEFEGREDLAQVSLGLCVDLLNGFVRWKGEDGDVHGLQRGEIARKQDVSWMLMSQTG